MEKMIEAGQGHQAQGALTVDKLDMQVTKEEFVTQLKKGKLRRQVPQGRNMLEAWRIMLDE